MWYTVFHVTYVLSMKTTSALLSWSSSSSWGINQYLSRTKVWDTMCWDISAKAWMDLQKQRQQVNTLLWRATLSATTRTNFHFFSVLLISLFPRELNSSVHEIGTKFIPIIRVYYLEATLVISWMFLSIKYNFYNS